MVDRVLGVPSPFADRYAVVRELGRGASAVVILARDLVHDREVALKVLSAEYASVLGSERFRREVRLDRRLQHPYVVPILDSGEWEGWLYIVMPVIEGSALRARLSAQHQLPVDEAVRYAREIADALQHAHDHGVIHRDVKPENILLSGGHACLADFGIARALVPASGDDITTTGVVLGTPGYMSPEQASGDALDGRTDQYALGCVLFEMLAGMPPFVGATSHSIIQQRMARAAPSVQQYRPSVGNGLAQVVARALEMAPADRFESMRAMGEALQTASSPSPYGMEAVAPTHIPRSSRRRWVGGGVGALIVAAAVGWFAFATGEAPPPVSRSGLVALVGDPDSANVEARRWFLRGREALAAGWLDSAEAAFARAAGADDRFALADLWQAQAMQWNPAHTSSDEWIGAATRAVRSRGRLGVRDSLHAAALASLGERRYPEACEAFDAMVRADSQSFVGLFGSGECRRLDRAVLRDPSSPSKWRFRAELSHAIRAYTEALAFAPGEIVGPAFGRAQQVFYSTASRVRSGRAVPPDTGDFFAYPSLRNDTVAFVPFRTGVATSLEPMTSEQELTGAWRAMEAQELAFVRRWLQRMPESPYARLARALALEQVDSPSGDQDTTADARSVLREARARTSDARARLALAAAEVRVLVKATRWDEAGRLADSIVQRPPTNEYTVLAALAVLRGAEREASAFLRDGWRQPARARDDLGTDAPEAVLDAVAPLAAAVATGRCEGAHLDSLLRNVRDRISAIVEPRQQTAMRTRILDDLLVQAAPCTGGASMREVGTGLSVTGKLAAAAAGGDRPGTLSALRRIDDHRAGINRASLSWDAVALEGWALAAIGDTAHAIARVDSVLEVLRYTTSPFTSRARLAGGLRRTLWLRADLAQRTGDSVTARRWQDALRNLAGWP